MCLLHKDEKSTPPPRPHHHHYHVDEGWGQRRSYLLNDLKLCLNSGKSLYFPSQEKLIKTCVQRYSPTPLPKLCSNLLPPPPAPRHLQIRLVRPSLTFLGHHTLLIWQNWLNFAPAFSVTAIFLETATTPPREVQNFPPPPNWGP